MLNVSLFLSRFYDEIGTPLLSDIRINYTDDSVQYVTQHLFPNYFNGSEIVIAGKLTNHSADSLHVQVTASNNDRSISLETDVPLQERQKETEKHVKAAKEAMETGDKALGSGLAQELGVDLGPVAEDFVERIWGFLSVKEGLRSRLRSQTSKEREDHTQQATNLSLAYNFLSPLTNLEVEKPKLLADGTIAPQPTINAAASEADSSANELPEDTRDEKPEKANERPGSQISSPGKTNGEVASSGSGFEQGYQTKLHRTTTSLKNLLLKSMQTLNISQCLNLLNPFSPIQYFCRFTNVDHTFGQSQYGQIIELDYTCVYTSSFPIGAPKRCKLQTFQGNISNDFWIVPD